MDRLDRFGGSKLAKAITYVKNQKKYLENYVLGGDYLLSNDQRNAENTPIETVAMVYRLLKKNVQFQFFIRPFVIFYKHIKSVPMP